MIFFRNEDGSNVEELKRKISANNNPLHIAIIMDGNGRWAKKRNLPRNVGHRKGADALNNIVLFANDIGIKYLTVYAFSTENWNRPKEEVEALMKLLNEFLDRFNKDFGKRNIRIRHIGDPSALPAEIQEKVKYVEEKTKGNDGLSFNVALNYGGRYEIIEVLKKLSADIKTGKVKEDEIDENLLTKYLFTKDIPDPDLIIRTSGECRLSNFLLWQSAYSEFWFDDVLWPDFKEKHLIKAISDFQKRNRRYGGI